MPLVSEVNLDDYPELKKLSEKRTVLLKDGILGSAPGVIYDEHGLRRDDYTARGIRSAELEEAHARLEASWKAYCAANYSAREA